MFSAELGLSQSIFTVSGTYSPVILWAVNKPAGFCIPDRSCEVRCCLVHFPNCCDNETLLRPMWKFVLVVKATCGHLKHRSFLRRSRARWTSRASSVRAGSRSSRGAQRDLWRGFTFLTADFCNLLGCSHSFIIPDAIVGQG